MLQQCLLNHQIRKLKGCSCQYKYKFQAISLNLVKLTLGSGSANVIADGRHTYFNMYTPIVSGVGDLVYAQNSLKLVLDKYMLFKKLNKIVPNSGEQS